MASQKDSEGDGLASLGLQDRLLEVAVVVGMDCETGLQIRKTGQTEGEELASVSLFETDFQGFLLDILSGPQDNSSRGGSGGGDELRSGVVNKFTLKRRNATSTKLSKPKLLRRAVSVRRLRKKANKHEEVPVSTDFLSNMPSLCLPEDSKVYEYPHEPTIHCTVLTDIDGFRHYAVILTFYQQYFAIRTGAQSWSLDRKLSSDQRQIVNGNDHGPYSCYIPHCICLVSMKPYFRVLKDALSCFHKEYLTSRSDSLRKILEKYVTNLSLVVCPPPTIRIRFTLSSLPIILPPPTKYENIIDIDLRWPLFIFMRRPTVLMNILACIMHEQRIVFFSSDFTLLALVMECFLCYIRPMDWHHQYIPILFAEIVGFVECPGIFMMGCHSRHKPEIERIENDLFLVDLDHGTIQTNSNSSSESDGGRLGQFALAMPDFAVQSLLKRLGDYQLHGYVHSVWQVNPVTLEEIREYNLKIRQNLNQRILNIFMEFMVDIFGSTLHYLDHERHEFKVDKFLESINATDSPFYIKVSKSYMFRRFIRQRLERISDHFSIVYTNRHEKKLVVKESRSRVQATETVTEEGIHGTKDSHANSRPISRVGSASLGSMRENEGDALFSHDNLSADHFSNTGDRPSTKIPGPMNGFQTSECASQISLTLPSFPVQGTNFNAKHFYHRCIGVITDKLGSGSDGSGSLASSNRAALLLLRGLYRLAEESLVSGLQDIAATAKEDASFYPDKIVKKVITSLNQQEFRMIEQHSLHKSIPSRSKTVALRTMSTVTNQMRSYFADDNTALYSLRKEPFTFVLERADVTTDQAVISTLFKALCDCSESAKTEIEPEPFNAFYQTWQQLKNDSRKARKNFDADECRLPSELQPKRLSQCGSESDQFLSFMYNEEILKVSETVLTNKGNGRLVLTTLRIIFIGAGSRDCKMLMKLEDILYLKEGKLKYFLTSTAALFIKLQNAPTDSVFKVGLKSQCNLWMHLINEIKTGRKRSRDQCDDHFAQRTAAQNVFIADAFFSSVTEEGLMKPEYALEWVSKLCKFETQTLSGEFTSFSNETQEMIVMVMDLSPKESKKSGVSSMAYSAAGIDETPQIWVTLKSGKLRLIDTTTWILDPKPVKEWDTKPKCLHLVENNELWVGGEDGNIYVLSLQTMKRMRILQDHNAALVDIIEAKNGLIASAEVSGKIILWVPESSQVHETFEAYEEPVDLVAFTPFKDLLCCCSTIHIVLCDYIGNQLQRFEPGGSTAIMNSNLTCCTLEETDEIWAGDDHGAIYAWNVDIELPGMHQTDYNMAVTKPKLAGVISDNSCITCMTKHNGKLWTGNSTGEIIIFNTKEPKQECSIRAHSGTITSIFALENRYMISGSGDDHGKIVLWRQDKR